MPSRAWRFIELARLGDALGARVPRAPGLFLTALVCVCAAWPDALAAPALVALLVGAGVVAVTSGPPDRAGVGGIALTVAGPLYIGLPLGALISIGWTHSREAAFLVVLTVVASDSTQYYAGRLFGRTLLAPAISPKKTVEGAIGGFVGGAVAMALAGRPVAAGDAARDPAAARRSCWSRSASSATCSSRC